MSERLKLTKVDLTRAATLAQAGCTVTFHPDGRITVSPVDAAAKSAPDSVAEWRRRRNEGKANGRP